MTPPPSNFLTVRQLAKKVAVHPETVKRWIRDGKIPPPAKSRRGWFIFDQEDVKIAEHYANTIYLPPHKLQRPLFPQEAAR